MEKIAAIIQARLDSSRLPHKVMKNIFKGKNSLDLLHERISNSKNIGSTIFAVPEKDRQIIDYLKERGYKFTCGDEKNVTQRYLKAACEFNIEKIVRITADCPLVDPKIIDECVNFSNDYDYVSNNTPPEESDYANGSDVEVFSTILLKRRSESYKSNRDNEHVTFPMWDGRMKISKYRLKKEISDKNVRITIDNEEDVKVIRDILKFSNNSFINYDSIVKIYNKLDLYKINGKYHYSEGWR